MSAARPAAQLPVALVPLLALALTACAPGAPGEPQSPPDWPSLLEEILQAHPGPVVEGRDGWLFFPPELRHLAAGTFWEPGAETAPEGPLAAILDFRDQLRSAGVELLFVPVPAKAAVYPGVLPSAPADFGLDPHHRVDAADGRFVELLQRFDVAALDLTPLFLERAGDGGDALYCRHDTHWSPRGIEVAAARIAEEVRRRPWVQATERVELEKEARRIEIAGDLWRRLPEPRPQKETLSVQVVGRPGEGGIEPLEPDPASPVLLLGDSHTLVFHAGGELHARGAGLADHLAYELGFPVDLLGVRGSGATAARINLMRRPEGLAGKELVVWCLSVREYTQGQAWQKVPVVAATPSP